jgi:hypothetical protein
VDTIAHMEAMSKRKHVLLLSGINLNFIDSPSRNPAAVPVTSYEIKVEFFDCVSSSLVIFCGNL